MADYTKLGYNSRLINENSPIAQNQARQDALRFDGNFYDVGIITGAKIVNEAVTGSKIAANSIAGSHIINATITGVDLAGSAVAGTHIGLGAVTQTKLAADSVTGSNIIDGGIGQNDIAASVITGTHIIDGGVNGSDLAGSAVAGTHIALNAVTNVKINDYDLAKGTGASLNVTNTGTAGTWNSTSRFATGTALGTSGTIAVEQAGGTINLIFIGGLFTGTS